MTRTYGRAAIYARVSTLDQEPENQLAELRQYVGARSWTGVEYVDKGVSGSTEKRPALDRLIRETPGGDTSMSSSAGAWTGSGGTCATW